MKRINLFSIESFATAMFKIKKTRSWIRNFFGFTRAETDGFIVLLLIIILVLIAPFIFKAISTSTYTMSAQDKVILDSLAHQLSSRKERPKTFPETPYASIELFEFNPNEATLEHFIALGLPKYVAQRVLNYRQAGGAFTIKSDFQKIYGLSKEDFDRLYAYIQLPENVPEHPSSKNKLSYTTLTEAAPSKSRATKAERSFQKIDINVCDTTELKKIYGIGPVLAERIIKYRTLLGGFAALSQLEEVYGLKEETLHELYTNVYIAHIDSLDKIAINEDDARTMAAHPYISHSLAKAIAAYRKQHGPFSTPQGLLNIQILDSATFIKLKPYIGL